MLSHQTSENVINFRINLDKFKNESVNSCSNNFWKIANLIIDKFVEILII